MMFVYTADRPSDLDSRPSALHGREAHAERRSLSDGALHGYRAMVGIHDRLGDRQSQAGSRDCLIDRHRGTEEAIEQLCLLGGRDAESGVGNLEEYVTVLERGADSHAPAGGCELDRVRDKVVHHLGESDRVALDPAPRCPGQAQVDLLRIRRRSRRLDAILRQRVEVDLVDVEGQRPVCFGDQQQVADELVQAVGASLGDGDE